MIDNWAAERDYRTSAVDERWWSQITDEYAVVDSDLNGYFEEAGVTPRFVDEDEDVTVYALEFRFEICPACDGRGSYVNPSIDAHGLTRSDFDEDPDFAESYWSGGFDIRCVLCQGERVVPVPYDSRARVAITRLAHDRHVDRQTRIMESGGWA